jgi:multiple sugar transport system ATP-binding protein
MATVETRRLVKHFDGLAAVAGIDLPVREGEFLVLLGPSGCGKTTLLRMIAGLETPTSGDVLIDGKVVTELPPRSRNIAMVFQSYALYPHLTVEANIAFPLAARGMRGAAVTEQVQRAATMFGIDKLLKRKPRQLSGGERQRVALARAVVEGLRHVAPPALPPGQRPELELRDLPGRDRPREGARDLARDRRRLGLSLRDRLQARGPLRSHR